MSAIWLGMITRSVPYRSSLYALHTLDALFALHTLNTLRSDTACCARRPLTSLPSLLARAAQGIIEDRVYYRSSDRSLDSLNSLRTGASNRAWRTLTAL